MHLMSKLIRALNASDKRSQKVVANTLNFAQWSKSTYTQEIYIKVETH